MGRFNWAPGQQKEPSDGKHVFPDWFSKTSAEPSRQALSAMMKEHAANSPPSTIHKHSRTNTLSSVPSRESKSLSSRSGTRTSRPASGQNASAESSTSPRQQEKPAYPLTPKGPHIVRKQTSKFNLTSNEPATGPAPANYSRPRGISRVKSAGQLLSLHHKKESSPMQISSPFDFQHVTHADQSQYQQMKKANTLELARSFQALQTRQQPDQDHGGVAAADLKCTPGPSTPAHTDVPVPAILATTAAMPSPPKPSPPPKDDVALPYVDADLSSSSSLENFSYLIKASPVLRGEVELVTDFPESTLHEPKQVSGVPRSPAAGRFTLDIINKVPSSPQPPTPQLAPSPMLDKPLPQPPTVVHAVSTSDSSTVLMKSSPPPDVPQHGSRRSSFSFIAAPESVDLVDDSPPRSSPLPHEPSPSAFNVPSQQGQRFSQRMSTSNTLSTTTSPSKSTKAGKRISVGIKNINVDDWENAIDYSWDHALDYDEDEDDLMEMNGPSATSKSDTLPQKAFVAAPSRKYPSQAHTTRNDATRHSTLRHHKSEMSLRGLGINSTQRDSFVLDDGFGYRRAAPRVGMQKRASGSPLSKSSSQESIILSIASSIMSTHRSSNSSTSFGDMSHFPYPEDETPLPPMPTSMKLETAGSISSAETVTRGGASFVAQSQATETEPIGDTLEDLPVISHERGLSGSQTATMSSRRSSMTPAAKAVNRQRACTLGHRARTPSRASYSLFPVPQTTPPAA